MPRPKCRVLKYITAWAFLLILGPNVQPLYAQTPSAIGELPAAVVPYTSYMEGGPPVVQVVLNGGRKANFMLDTGCSVGFISAELVKQMGLAISDAVNDAGKPVFLEGKQLQAVQMTELKLGSVSLPTALVVAKRAKFSLMPRLPIDGVIGTNALLGKTLFIDPEHHQITLWAGSLSEAGRKILPLKDASVCKARFVKDSGLLYLPTHLQYKSDTLPAELALDTGANNISLTAALAERLNVLGSGQKNKATSTATFFGNLKVRTVTLDAILLDTTSGPALPIVKPSVDCFQTDVANFGGAHIGMNLLSKFYTLVDFAEQKVYFKSLYDRQSDVGLGFTVQEVPPTRLIVTGMDRGWPAQEAGLMQGDEILKIDELLLPGNQEALESMIKAKMRQREGAQVVLTVKRKGEDTPRQLTLTFRKGPQQSSEK